MFNICFFQEIFFYVIAKRFSKRLHVLFKNCVDLKHEGVNVNQDFCGLCNTIKVVDLFWKEREEILSSLSSMCAFLLNIYQRKLRSVTQSHFFVQLNVFSGRSRNLVPGRLNLLVLDCDEFWKGGVVYRIKKTMDFVDFGWIFANIVQNFTHICLKQWR